MNRALIAASPLNSLQIIIIGAGIGGLTLANLLRMPVPRAEHWDSRSKED